MSRLLRVSDYVLLASALAGDMFNELRVGGEIMRGAMREMYGYVPSKYQRTSYYSTVSRMLTVGSIAKEVDDRGRVKLVLTSAGKESFKRRFPLFMKKKKWDGRFMVCIFDIAEKRKKDRDLLRGKLAELGFGMMQKSVWISPYHFEDDMREFLVNAGLADSVFVLTARKLWAGNIKSLAWKVWRLDDVDKRYRRIIRNSKKLLRKKKVSRKKATRIYNDFLNALTEDPMLPNELLPVGWLHKKVSDCIGELINNVGLETLIINKRSPQNYQGL